MIFTIPNSCGDPEPDAPLLSERWSDEARQGALAARRTGGKYKTKKDKAKDLRRGDPGFADREGTERAAASVRKRTDDAEASGARTAADRAKRVRDEGSYFEKRRAEKAAAAAKAEKDAKAEKEQQAKGGGGKGGGAPKDPGKPKREKEETNEKGERVLHYSDGSTVTVHGDGKATRRKPDGSETTGKYSDPKPKDDPEGFASDTPESKERERKKAESEAAKVTRERVSADKKTAAEKKAADKKTAAEQKATASKEPKKKAAAPTPRSPEERTQWKERVRQRLQHRHARRMERRQRRAQRTSARPPG